VSLVISVNNAPLPVELVRFAAAWAGKAAQLSWTTASEKSNSHFIVERSFDGEAFQSVGRLAGAGTTPSPTNYQFADGSVPRGSARTLYYRLRQVDDNRSAQVSSVRTVVVPAIEQVLTASVFPNPSEKAASVQLDTFDAGAVTFTIQDVLGQLLLAKTVAATTGKQNIALPETALLPAGIYFLTVRQGQLKQVVKMIKQ
jgi:hypothetical protein